MEIRPILSALLRSKTGAVLIASQVALTLAIVSNAAFVVSARLATASRPSGVDEPNVFLLSYSGSREIDDRAAMVQRDLETLRAIPGVVGAVPTNQLPLTQSGWSSGLSTNPQDPASDTGAATFMGDEAFVTTLGLRIVEGRNFEPSEVREINESEGDPEADTVIVTRHL